MGSGADLEHVMAACPSLQHLSIHSSGLDEDCGSVSGPPPTPPTPQHFPPPIPSVSSMPVMMLFDHSIPFGHLYWQSASLLPNERTCTKDNTASFSKLWRLYQIIMHRARSLVQLHAPWHEAATWWMQAPS